MSAVILPFVIPARRKHADGAFAATNIIARRMGYADHLAARASAEVKKEVLAGKKSAAKAVADMKADLSLAARNDGGLLA